MGHGCPLDLASSNFVPNIETIHPLRLAQHFLANHSQTIADSLCKKRMEIFCVPFLPVTTVLFQPRLHVLVRSEEVLRAFVHRLLLGHGIFVVFQQKTSHLQVHDCVLTLKCGIA